MEFTTKEKEGIIFVYLTGDLLGEQNGPALMEIVNEKTSAGYLKCVVDLSGVRYMNSSGIGVLITILTKFRNKGGDAVLIQLSEQIQKLLVVTKLDSIFQITDDENKAINLLKDGA